MAVSATTAFSLAGSSKPSRKSAGIHEPRPLLKLLAVPKRTLGPAVPHGRRAPLGCKGLAAAAAGSTAVCTVRRRRGAWRRLAARRAVPASKETPWLEILGAVGGALLDIFKAPPKEATGTNAPGLQEMGVKPHAALQECEVIDVRSGEALQADQLLKPVLKGRAAGCFFLTHWGDFNSWEEAQQVRSAVKAGRLDGSAVVLVGIGSVASGRRFAEMLELPEEVRVYADPRAACHTALCFSRGALPQYADSLSPYLRVFLMLLGVGSPGTISTVLGGYFGNRSLPATATEWIDDALRQGATQGRWPTAVPDMMGDWKTLDLKEVGNGVWDEGFGKGGLRPFELATVRLQNMVGGIIANWKDLAPDDDELLVQQGGCLVTDAQGEVTYYFRDKGILTYVPFDEALAAMQP